MKNLVSIIVNCFNGEKYLSKALNSLLNQKYKNFEVIFIDNCSTDSSSKIFKSIKDKRFNYYKTKKKISLYASRNFALRKTKGKFVAFLDVDDWWNEDYLSSRKKFFLSSKIYGFSYSNCYHYFENRDNFKVFYKKNLPSGFILDDLLKYYFIKISSVIIKKEIINFHKFDSFYNIIGDYDLILRIAEKYKGLGFQYKSLNIRIHQDNFTHNNRKMFYKEFLYWIKKQNFKKKIFRQNKQLLLQRLEYLRLIYLLSSKKSIRLFIDIIKFPSFFLKLKLIVIYILPKFIIKIKHRYS